MASQPRCLFCFLARLAAATSFFLISAAPAQNSNTPELLVGTWRLEVNDRNPPRELEILSVEATGKNSLAEARYGWFGKNLRRAEAEVTWADPPTLTMRTPAGAEVRLRQTAPGVFEGSLQAKNGTYTAVARLLANHAPVRSTDVALFDQGAPDASRPDLKAGSVVYPKDAKIELVYLGGNDCPPCRAWRATELPRLERAPEMTGVKFTYVVKSVQSPVPVSFLPDAIKPLGNQLLDASGRQGGSSQNALVVNGKIANYWWGGATTEEIVAMIRAVREGRPLPGTPCLRWAVPRRCVTPG